MELLARADDYSLLSLFKACLAERTLALFSGLELVEVLGLARPVEVVVTTASSATSSENLSGSGK